ncbi:hypothetical protein Tco_1351453 [Tanacetum coccineum]
MARDFTSETIFIFPSHFLALKYLMKCVLFSNASPAQDKEQKTTFTEDLDAYDSNCYDVSNAKEVLMVNLSNYGSYVISEVPHSEPYHHDMDNQSVHAMQDFEQTPVVDFTNNEITSYQNPFYLKKAQRFNPTLYDGSVISNQHVVIPVIDDEETLILEEVSRSKMLAKQNDPISKEKKINTTPISYVKLNQLSEDFGKRFVLQQELSAEQAFWLQTSHPNTDQYDISPVKIEAPRELPKEVMLTVMNSTAVFRDSVNLEMQSSESYDKCSNLDAELLKKQNAYNEILKIYSQLEKHCISLELTMQLNQEIFQKDKSCNSQNALEIPEYFENNYAKA